MKHPYAKVAAAIAVVLALAATSVAAPAVFHVDREFYPFYPSLIKWNKSPAEFTPPADCGGCHENSSGSGTAPCTSLPSLTRSTRGS